MFLTHLDPFRALRRREDVFEDLFQDFLRRPEGNGGPIEPAADVSETDDEITVKLEMPGVEKDQITVTVKDDLLTVRGETRKETEEKKKNFYRQEIRYGAFERALGLPAEVDAGRVTADLKSGMLTVKLPKSKQPKAHQVQVKVAS